MNNFYIAREDELYHHGILGMKWGQKNGPPYPLSASAHSKSEKKAGWRKSLNSSSSFGLTDNQKKILKYGAIALGVSGAAFLAYKTGCLDSINTELKVAKIKGVQLSKDIVKKIADEKIRGVRVSLPKGAELRRVINSNSLDDDIKYVSFDKRDSENYRFNVKTNKGLTGGPKQEIVYKATEKIKAPSYKEANKIFNRFLANNPEYIESLKKDCINNYAKEMSIPDAIKRVNKEFSDNKELFKIANKRIVDRGESSKQYIDTFIKKGFNAIEDYADKGIASINPLIVIKSGTLVETGRKQVSEIFKDETLLSTEYFREIQRVGAAIRK